MEKCHGFRLVRKTSFINHTLVFGILSDKGKNIKTESELRFSISSQAGNLSRKIYKECGVGIEALKELKGIYLVYIEKQEIVSCIYEKQQKILGKIGLNLEYK